MEKQKVRHGLVKVLKGFLIGYAVVFVLATAFQRQIIYQTWSIGFEEATKRPFGQGLTQGTVNTNDGEMLKAYWKKPAPGMPVIITFHGNAGTPQPNANRFSGKPWSDRGYGVLAIAYRGYPGSSGSPSEHGLLEDGRAAYDFARKHAPTSHIIVHGHSLGSGVAVGISAERRVLAAILDAPFTNLEDMATDRFPVLPTWSMFDTFRNDERIKDVHAQKVFIVHGLSDTVVPFRYGKRLSELRPDAVFFPVSGASHDDVLGMRDTEIERAITEMVKAGTK